MGSEMCIRDSPPSVQAISALDTSSRKEFWGSSHNSWFTVDDWPLHSFGCIPDPVHSRIHSESDIKVSTPASVELKRKWVWHSGI